MPGCNSPSKPSSSNNSNAPCNSSSQSCSNPPCPPCPAYASVDNSKDVESYNCAGLAHRTYTYMGNVTTVKSRLAGGQSISCSSNCSRCQVKHWLWEYDIHLEDADGNTISAQSSRDFHTVAGRCDENGNNPTSVYSKNGARPLEGPGTGPSFKPPAKNQATSNDRHATPATDGRGRPIYKVRSNMVETCYCLPCP